MKNYSLVILLWISSTSLVLSHGEYHDTNKPESVTVISKKKIQPEQNVIFSIESESNSIIIYNNVPIKELRIYDNNGKLIQTNKHLDRLHVYDTTSLSNGKYAFTIQVADQVITHIYKKNK